MNSSITSVSAEVIKNSRGTEGVAVTVKTETASGTFAVPEGASTGSKEVKAIKAYDAVRNIEERIAPALLGKDAAEQLAVDNLLHELDGSELFERIGGNTAIGVSVACAKAAAAALNIEPWGHIRTLLGKEVKSEPRLVVNLINGGKHAPYGSPIQEHQIIPDTTDVALAYNLACTVQEKLAVILEEKYGSDGLSRGDEGGFAIPSVSVFDPFVHLQEAIDAIETPVAIYIGADIAASSFFEDPLYHIENDRKDERALLSFYDELLSRVRNLRFLEDPFFETDLASFSSLASAHKELTIIGDDLTVTNAVLLQKAIDAGAVSALIIKPNQIGTLSDTLATIALAHTHGIRTIVSHRSGETMDDFIADLSWGSGSYGLKAGAPHSKERDAKYKRLIQIQNSNHA